MEMTWTVPVAIILAGVTYAIFARFFSHKERLATLQGRRAEQSASEK
jgi:hypothetical protein